MDLKDLGPKIVGLHAMAAMMTGIPELVISDKEGNDLAEAVAEVGKHYDIAFDPKVVCWVNLAVVSFGVYAPRVIHLMRRTQQQQQQQRQQSDSTLATDPVDPGYIDNVPVVTQ